MSLFQKKYKWRVLPHSKGKRRPPARFAPLVRWEDAKRAYLKFIDNEIITRHITRNPFTLGYTYSYTLLYTKTPFCTIFSKISNNYHTRSVHFITQQNYILV